MSVFTVDRSALAQAQYGQYRALAGGFVADTLEKLERDVLAVPAHALHRDHALKDDLAGVWRLKIKSVRLRVFYIVSSKAQRVRVLWIGYRKEGDKNDAYTVFGKMLARGDFDADFVALGLVRA